MEEKHWLSIAFIVLFILGLCGAPDKKDKNHSHGIMDSNAVYICTGPHSECYHKTTSCRGIRKCSAEIKGVSIEEAKEMGRRPCRYCY